MSSILSGIEGAAARTAELAVGYGAGAAVSAILGPASAKLAQEAWDGAPVEVIPPVDLAAMVVQGVLGEPEAAAEARKSGYSAERFHELVRVNGSPPGPDQLLDLWLRGEVSEDEVNRGLLQSRLKPEWVDSVKLLRVQLLQVADLASMVVQSILTEPDAAAQAAKLGYSAEAFHRLVRLAGNPPGPHEALEMWNRGLLTEDEATLALLQSRLKPEWVEQFKRLRYRPATASQAAEAVVRERIPHAEGAAIAAENGIGRAAFDLMVETGGRPIGIMQALTLYNRREFTVADVREVVARSNVRTEYTADILKLAVRYPPLFQIARLITSGAIDDAYATELIEHQGYPAKLAEGIVASAHAGKTGKHKDISLAIVEALYESGLDSRPEAIAAIEHLGYNEHQAEDLLNVFLARRIVAELVHGIGMIRTRYTSWKIDRPTAIHEVGALTGDPAVIERLLPMWDTERETSAPVLTPGQIGQALKYGRFTTDEAMQHWQQRGYTLDDALTLAWIVSKGDPRPAAPSA